MSVGDERRLPGRCIDRNVEAVAARCAMVQTGEGRAAGRCVSGSPRFIGGFVIERHDSLPTLVHGLHPLRLDLIGRSNLYSQLRHVSTIGTTSLKIPVG